MSKELKTVVADDGSSAEIPATKPPMGCPPRWSWLEDRASRLASSIAGALREKRLRDDDDGRDAIRGWSRELIEIMDLLEVDKKE